jgi:hypothetical protein
LRLDQQQWDPLLVHRVTGLLAQQHQRRPDRALAEDHLGYPPIRKAGGAGAGMVGGCDQVQFSAG